MTDQPDAPLPALQPFRHRQDGVTPERQQRFCAALRQTGFVSHAARAIGVSVQSLRRARARMPAFARAWDEAYAAARDPAAAADPLAGKSELERVAYRRAVDGVDEPVIEKGQVVAWRKRFSDQALKLALAGERAAKAARPAAPERRPTSAEVDASILRKLDALERADRRQAVAEAKRLLREGKVP